MKSFIEDRRNVVGFIVNLFFAKLMFETTSTSRTPDD
jgi:hypothetical protein